MKCIRDTLQDGKKSYCGKNLNAQFYFLEPSHAILHSQQGGMLLICDDCRKKINKIMVGE